MKTKQWMRKSIAVVVMIMSVAALCGCGKKAEDLKPYEWIMDGEVVSYYDSVKEIDATICPTFSEFFEGRKSDSKNYVVSKDGEEIRTFITLDSSVVTYKGICVGDNISVVEDSFSYEYRYEGVSCVVYFDGTVEVDPEVHGYDDDLSILYYLEEEGVIQEIFVMDGLFNRTME